MGYLSYPGTLRLLVTRKIAISWWYAVQGNMDEPNTLQTGFLVFNSARKTFPYLYLCCRSKGCTPSQSFSVPLTNDISNENYATYCHSTGAFWMVEGWRSRIKPGKYVCECRRCFYGHCSTH